MTRPSPDRHAGDVGVTDAGDPHDAHAAHAVLLERVLRIGRSRASKVAYGLLRVSCRALLLPYLRVRSRGKEHLARPGPMIVAPTHRSNLDVLLIGSLTDRRVWSLAKVELFRGRIGAWIMASIGCFPVRRGALDREALTAAEDLLRAGRAVVVFPEGTRQTGSTVHEVFDGAVYLSARTGAPIVPIGIAGADEALPRGSRLIRRVRVGIVVGEPIPPPVVVGERLSRPARRAATAHLRERLQAVLDAAISLRSSTTP
jgi:1-acyl-sn-glycerol-3-phosphate acyltransferase